MRKWAEGRAWLLAVALVVAGCAQTVHPEGPAVVQPHFALDAAPSRPAVAAAAIPSVPPAGSFIAADGTALPLRVHPAKGRPRAVMLALHGFGDYGNFFAIPAADAFQAAGITVYAYDQRGHGGSPHPGEWSSAQAMVGDATAAAKLVQARHPGLPFFLYGHSMGGGVALLAVTDNPLSRAAGGPVVPVGTVLEAPSVFGRRFLPVVGRVGLFGLRRVAPGMQLDGSGLDIHPSDNGPMLRAYSRDPETLKAMRVDFIAGFLDLMDAAVEAAPRLPAPALVLFADHEEVLDKDSVDYLKRVLPRPGVRVEEVPNSWHMMSRGLERKDVLDREVQWIEEKSGGRRAPPAPPS